MINKINSISNYNQKKYYTNSQTSFGTVKYNIDGTEKIVHDLSTELELMLGLVKQSEKGSLAVENGDTFIINSGKNGYHQDIIMSNAVGQNIQIIKDYRNDLVGNILSKAFDKLTENIKKINNIES